MATSPYLIREARRLKIDTQAAGEPLPGATAEHRTRDYRFARTRREAGIENMEWEGRLKPLKPWLYWLTVSVCWAVVAASVSRIILFSDH
jgi:hypothetical protein